MPIYPLSWISHLSSYIWIHRASWGMPDAVLATAGIERRDTLPMSIVVGNADDHRQEKDENPEDDAIHFRLNSSYKTLPALLRMPRV